MEIKTNTKVSFIRHPFPNTISRAIKKIRNPNKKVPTQSFNQKEISQSNIPLPKNKKSKEKMLNTKVKYVQIKEEIKLVQTKIQIKIKKNINKGAEIKILKEEEQKVKIMILMKTQRKKEKEKKESSEENNMKNIKLV